MGVLLAGAAGAGLGIGGEATPAAAGAPTPLPCCTPQAGDVALRGWPLVRSLGLHFPSDAAALAAQEAFLIGSELLVAPALAPNATAVSVYLPAVPALAWTHVWSSANFSVPASGPGRSVDVAAPLGFPPVLYPAGSAVGAQFVANLRAAGLLRGWGD